MRRGVYGLRGGLSGTLETVDLSALSGREEALCAHWTAMVRGSKALLAVWLFLALLTVGEGISKWDRRELGGSGMWYRSPSALGHILLAVSSCTALKLCIPQGPECARPPHTNARAIKGVVDCASYSYNNGHVYSCVLS